MHLLDFVPYPMVIFKKDGRVNYVNPAFTDLFGWTLDELAGKAIPYVPPNVVEEDGESIINPAWKESIRRFETRRLTKDGRVLNVAVRVTTFSEGAEDDDAELVVLRDLTWEKRAARNKEVLLRISTALPAYPELEKLLDYISDEIRVIMNTEVALVILLDTQRNEFSYVGVAHDNTATEKRIKEFRFPADKSIAGKVVRTGEPIIVSDTSREPDFYPGVDQKIGYTTKNMLEVPLRGKDRVIGVLCARNKREGQFDRTDVELLTMIAGTVALFIENARVSEQLREAYREVTSSNQAKEKAINHLSHELKTPVSVLKISLNFLEKKMKALPAKDWMPGLERARRNLNRVIDIQHQVEDIMQDRPYKNQGHIFEGFLVARDIAVYSSLRPFDFNAGGKGADLLRMKIFSERYNFKINLTSSRCQFIPRERDACPGRIRRCAFCIDKEACYHSGATVFNLFFPFKAEATLA